MFEFREFSTEDEDDEEQDENDAADDEDEEFLPLGDMMSAGEHEGGELRLPPHRRCACHTLNLVASKDLEDSLARPGPLRTASTNVLTKCQAFWHKQSRSTVAQDVVKDRPSKVFSVPNAFDGRETCCRKHRKYWSEEPARGCCKH